MSDYSDKVAVLLAEGVRQQQLENIDAAERAYRAVLELDPTQPNALALLGMLAGMFGNFDTAIGCFLSSLERDPDNADIYHNLGETYRHLDDAAKALPCFAKAIELRPELYMAYRSAADVALAASEKAGTPEHARELIRMALQYRRTLAAKLRKIRHPDALGVLREALEIDPFDTETLRNLGNSLQDCGMLTESVEMFQRALALQPDDANTYSALGTSLYTLRRWEDSDDAFRRALEIDPDHKIARVNLVTCHLMHFLYEDDVTTGEIFSRHKQWGETITADLAPIAAAEAKPFRNTPDPERRLRVGFISGDFRDHPVAHFFRPLLAEHDRNALDIYCYGENERTDPYTDVLKRTGGTWRFASVAAPDSALREQLRADQIDIAVDLSGQTGGTRLSALAVRATPVTATWLGYPASTGLPAIDWRITDVLADPPGVERYHSEKLLRLPDGFLCYVPNGESLPPAAPPPVLTRGFITFGSFNNALKITASTVRCWVAILDALPSSRLILKAGSLADPVVRNSFSEQFEKLGVEPSRVELRSQLADHGEHLSAYADIDIGLDPLTYNGTTTTCEALWMGVPVISLVGDRHAARVGFDLLSRIGLGALAAPDLATYISLAVNLAQDVPRLLELRRGLRERMRASSLCDATRFARQFEAGLREIWQRWCAESLI